MNKRQIYTIHLPGTLSADAEGVIPMSSNVGATLIEVAALASNNSDATLQLGVGGTNADDDGIMTPKAIGDSGTPRLFTVADFNGALADPIGTNCPIFGPKALLTWKLNYNGAGPNEVQIVTPANATGGTFTLTFDGQTTAAIAYNATAATVAAALKALSNIGDNDILVTGNAGGPWTVTFIGALAETNVAQLTADATSTTGVNEVQLVTITGGPTGGTFTLTFNGQTTPAQAYNVSAATLQTALRALTSINGANVTVTGDAGGPFTITFIGTLADANQPAITANAASLTGGTTPGVTIDTTTPGADATVTIATQTAGGPLTAAQNVDIVITMLLGGATSGVSGLIP